MYIPIFKTGEAEIRAIERLTTEMISGITPIIELTRGRQKTITESNNKLVTYPFDKRLSKVKDVFKGRSVFFDLTGDEGLLSNEVYALYAYDNGYENWHNFLKSHIGEDGFKEIIPAILFNWGDPDFELNFSRQVKGAAENFKAVMYRSSIQTKDCYDELPMILNYLPNDCSLWIVMDVGYLQESAVELAYNRCIKRIQNLEEKILKGRKVNFVVAATSYPERVFDYGDGNPILVSHSEVSLYEKLRCNRPYIYYSDYAGTNPIRKDMIVMARGWIPRIDIPMSHMTKVFWKRRPKGTTEYKGTYITLAQEVVNDNNFPFQQKGEWGIDEIIGCSEGYVTSCAPAFWISVRIYNHILCQLKRLSLGTI